MKYKVTLKGRTYEVEVERGEAMIVDEYEAYAPAPAAPAAPVAAPAAAPAAPAATAAGNTVTAPLKRAVGQCERRTGGQGRRYSCHHRGHENGKRGGRPLRRRSKADRGQ